MGLVVKYAQAAVPPDKQTQHPLHRQLSIRTLNNIFQRNASEFVYCSDSNDLLMTR